jgi:hypothetical protein
MLSQLIFMGWISLHHGCKEISLSANRQRKGAMQSLRGFMKEKDIGKGVRTSLENFARYKNIEVYPLYAISNLSLEYPS